MRQEIGARFAAVLDALTARGKCELLLSLLRQRFGSKVAAK
ncbi:MAG TPA: hypothetical protein VNO30_22675 [Kofleriaceae bacterium]|nr:hypothetical protein [Kofleriaceae bacterium]